MSKGYSPAVLRLLQQGIELLQRGELAPAESIFQRVLREQRDNPDAWHLAGLAAHLSGRHPLAVDYIGRAVRLRDNVPDFHNNLGEAYRAQGLLEPAERHYRRALALNPRFARAYNNLGLLMLSRGEQAQAQSALRHAVALDPGLLEARANLATTLGETGQAAEALGHAEQVLAHVPGHYVALIAAARALAALGRTDESLAALDRALALDARNASAYHLKSQVLTDAGRPGEAEACVRQGLAASPGDPDLLNQLGSALFREQRHEEALPLFREAAARQPDNIEMCRNLAVTLGALCRHEEAAAEYRRGLERAPDDAKLHFGLAVSLLSQGCFDAAWPEWEWRFAANGHNSPAGARAWDGSDPAGKRLLVYGEQGAGDVVNFGRYFTLAAQRGAEVSVACAASLASLVQTIPGVSRVVPEGADPGEHDIACALMSLPLLLGTQSLQDVPASVPYLHADGVRAEEWRKRLGGAGPHVGIAWTGNPGHRHNALRSCPLPLWQPLLRLAPRGIHFHSLCKLPDGDRSLEGLPVSDAARELGDFADTAALIEALDLVICVDTSVAHIAGALARPVWLLLPFAADWRWLQGRQDSPWYPTMRIFRQPATGQWEDVIRQVAAELARKAP